MWYDVIKVPEINNFDKLRLKKFFEDKEVKRFLEMDDLKAVYLKGYSHQKDFFLFSDSVLLLTEFFLYYCNIDVFSDVGIKKIPNRLFYNLSFKNPSIKIPDEIASIDSEAFVRTNIEEFYGGEDLSYLGINAIYDCPNLRRIDLSKCKAHSVDGFGTPRQPIQSCPSIEELRLPRGITGFDINFTGVRQRIGNPALKIIEG